MNNNKRNSLFVKWVKSYLILLLVFAVVIGFLLLLGYQICSMRWWHVEDFGYFLIANIHRHWGIWFWGLLFILSVITAIWNFWKIQKETQAIADSVNQRKNDMIMYMAHDLKTPLTSVIGYLTLVSDEPELPAKAREKYTGIALKKALRLEELVNEFFDITRFNFSHMILEYSTVNMSVMVEQMLSEFKPLFDQKRLTCQFTKASEVQLWCDVDKMERVLDNLFKNIANYSYNDSEIEVYVEKLNNCGMRLVTRNRGKTIAPEMLEHIFEQFFRLDSARSSSTGGSGLGLAAAKEIVLLHGGRIWCESRNETIEFIVEIPGR